MRRWHGLTPLAEMQPIWYEPKVQEKL
jgi:hypothetical protein